MYVAGESVSGSGSFIDKFLLGKTDVDTFVSKADMFEDVDYLKWMPWANEIERLGEERLPYTKGAFATRRYRNLFAELGYKQKDIDKKLKSVFESVFMDRIRSILKWGIQWLISAT